MKNRTVLVLALLLLPVPGFAQQALLGVWTGTGVQSNRAGKTSTWTIQMTMASPDQGTIEYPSLNCGGTLTFIRAVGDFREYREQLTHGMERCATNGIVGIQPRLGQIIWYWTGEGTTNAESSLAVSTLRQEPGRSYSTRATQGPRSPPS